MKIDGVDYNVKSCLEMGKEKFVETMTIHCSHLDKETQKIYLSDVYELLKAGG
jgi:hypothetical protein